MTTPLREQLLNRIRQNALIAPGDRVVVAVSGGADSLALLHLLHSLQDKIGFDLHVATLDHRLRGDAGAADAQFVRETAERLGIPITAEAVDVGALAIDEHHSIETAARIARYRFLAEVAFMVGSRIVATGHHRDDQVETILMRLLRGTASGAAGMAFISPMPFSGASKNIQLIRPLLLTSRAALRDYCDEHGLIPREDATNSQMDALRNRIRLEILPTLRTINPNIDAGLAQVGEVTALDNAFIEAAMKDTFHDAVIFGDGNARIDRRVFQRLHLALARRFLRQVLARLGMDDDITYERISAAVAIGRDGNVGATALLPNAMRLRVTQNDITIEPIFQEL